MYQRNSGTGHQPDDKHLLKNCSFWWGVVFVTILVFFLRFVVTSVFGYLRNFIFEFCFSKVNIYIRKDTCFKSGFRQKRAPTPYVHLG